MVAVYNSSSDTHFYKDFQHFTVAVCLHWHYVLFKGLLMTYALHMLFLFLKQALRQESILNCWYLVYFEFEAISH